MNFYLKLLYLFTLIASLSIGYFFADYYKVRKIILPSQNNVKVQTDWLLNQNLLLINNSSVKNRLEQRQPLLENIQITKQYPQTLVVNFEQAVPIMQINNNGLFLLISRNGRVIKQLTDPLPELITVIFYQKIRSFESSPGTELTNSDLVYISKLIKISKNYPIEILDIEVKRPQEITVTTKDGIQILLNSKKKIAKNWRIVHNIRKSLKIKGQQPKTINLLFDKPFITL